MVTFHTPATPFNTRLDEIADMAHDWEAVEHAWPAPSGIAWLRSAFAQSWSAAYPQPYIGTGPEDAMLSLYWKSPSETVTLEIDTVSRTGDLYRTPSPGVGDEECAPDLNLASADAWRQIASALGVKFGRHKNILVTGLGQPVPGRRNPGSRVPAQNQPATARFVSGRKRFRRRSGPRRVTRLSRGSTFSFGMAATRRRYLLHSGGAGGRRRHAGVPTRTR